MNMEDLIASVSSKTDLPTEQVRNVTAAVFGQLTKLIDTQSRLISPTITIAGITTPAKPAFKDRPECPEQKLAQMRIPAKRVNLQAGEVN